MPSSDSARVTFLDAAGTVARLRQAAQSLRDRDINVRAVVLFGSLAGGTATPASDADLLVVLNHDRRRVIDRVVEYARPFETAGLAPQVLPWTAAELQQRLAEDDPFAREIVTRGTVLAGAL